MANVPTTPPSATTEPQKRSCLKTGGLGCGGIVVILLLLVVGFSFYQVKLSNDLLTSAQEHHATGNYALALSDLQTLIADYETLEVAKEGKALLPQVQLDWAEALREEGSFEEALARYDEVSSDELADQVALGKQETLLAWGDALLAQQAFAKAQENFEQVLAEAEAGTTQANRARTGLADVYVGLSEQTLAAGDVATAYEYLSVVLENYQTGPSRDKALASFAQQAQALYELAQQERSKLDFASALGFLSAIVTYNAESELAAQVESELPAFYFEWGEALANAELYTDAIDVYQHLLKSYPESEFSEPANAALVDAQVAAITSSGTAGALPPPQDTGEKTGGTLSMLDISNDTVCPLIVLMSGPQSEAMKVAPETNQQTELPAGTYNMVVKSDDSEQLDAYCQNITPFATESILESGGIYKSNFIIEKREG